MRRTIPRLDARRGMLLMALLSGCGKNRGDDRQPAMPDTGVAADAGAESDASSDPDAPAGDGPQEPAEAGDAADGGPSADGGAGAPPELPDAAADAPEAPNDSGDAAALDADDPSDGSDARDGSDAGCAPGAADCAGVCQGPGVMTEAGCCASGEVDCAGVCRGQGVVIDGSCCASGRVDCNGVCEGPGIIIAWNACCASGVFDCAGVCDGPGVLRGTQCCPSGECPLPTCSDGHQNAVETDVDCGGPSCHACWLGQRCLEHADCVFPAACMDEFCAIRSTTFEQHVLELDVNSLARDPSDGTLFVSIGPDDAQLANGIAAFAPGQLTPNFTLPVGGEPWALAASDDGSALYVGLWGDQTGVARVDLEGRVIASVFSAGVHPTEGPVLVTDLDVRPGDPDTVAVTGEFWATSAKPSVHVFTNGVDRSTSGDLEDWDLNPGTPMFDLTSTAFVDSTTLYGFDGFSSGFELARMALRSDGLEVLSAEGDWIYAYDALLTSAGGKLFASTGQVFDPNGPRLLGTLPLLYPAATRLVPSPDGSRAYSVVYNPNTLKYEVGCYDTSSFTWTGGFELASPPNPREYVGVGQIEVWGTSGLAIRVYDVPGPGALVLLPHVLDEVLGCSPHAERPRNPPAVAGPDLTLGTMPVLDLAAYAIEEDPATGGLFVALSSADWRFPNRIAFVPSDVARVDWSAFVGSEPALLAATDDGATVWVALDGAQRVASVDTVFGRVSSSFPLRYDPLQGPDFARSLKAVPGAPRSVAVAGYRKSNSSTPPIRIYDDGVDRDAWKNRTSYDEWLSGLGLKGFDFDGPNRLYARDETDFGVIDVSPEGLEGAETYASLLGGGSMSFDLESRPGRLVSRNGESVDPAQPALVGSLGIEVLAVSPDGSRAYASTGGLTGRYLHCYRLDTFTETAKLKLDGLEDLGMVRDIAFWGPAGLALLAQGGHVVFLPGVLESTPGCSPIAGPPPPPGGASSPDSVTADGAVARYDFKDAQGLIRNPADGSVLVAVDSSDPRYPNQVVSFAPGSTSPSFALRVGSEPGPMAVADDGSRLYVGLRGAASIVSVDLISRVVGVPFSMGLTALGMSVFPIDMDVAPDDPATLLAVGNARVARYGDGSTGPLLYKNGLRTHPSTPRIREVVDPVLESIRTVSVEFAGPSTVFAYGGGGLAKFDAVAGSLQLVSIDEALLGYARTTAPEEMFYSAGRLIHGSGKVIDPAGPTLLGSTPSFYGKLAVSEDGATLLTVVKDDGAGFTVTCFDVATMQPTGSFTFEMPGEIPMFKPYPLQLALWGSSGLAVLMANTENDGYLLLAPNVRAGGC